MSFSAGSGNADDAGGRREDFFWLAGERFGRGLAGGAGGVDAGLACRAVGVAGVDGDDADFAARGAKMLRVDEERRGLDAIACECGGGGCGRVGNDQSEVGAAALFEAGLRRLRSESRGE